MKEFPILPCTTPEGGVKANSVLKDDTLWLTQAAMVGLFGVQKAAISKYQKNIFESGELVEGIVVSKMETTTPYGAIVGKAQKHAVNFYDRQIKKFLDGSAHWRDRWKKIRNETCGADAKGVKSARKSKENA